MIVGIVLAAAAIAVGAFSLARFSGRSRSLALLLLAGVFVGSTALAARNDDHGPTVQYLASSPGPTGDLPPEVERWRPLVTLIMPSERVDQWLELIACESKGNPDATGGLGERGLVQIHPYYHADATYDPAGNLRAAYRISDGGRDLEPWSCSDQVPGFVSPERPAADPPRRGGLSAASFEGR